MAISSLHPVEGGDVSNKGDHQFHLAVAVEDRMAMQDDAPTVDLLDPGDHLPCSHHIGVDDDIEDAVSSSSVTRCPSTRSEETPVSRCQESLT